jgi:hypothetical protein
MVNVIFFIQPAYDMHDNGECDLCMEKHWITMVVHGATFRFAI